MSSLPTLSILIPVYNEEKTLADVLKRVHATCPDAQVVCIDDGSTDASLSILKSHARPQDIVVTKQNGGKGSAIREGITHANGTYSIIQDADLEYDPEDIPALLSIAVENNLSCVLGSRRLKKQERQYSKFKYYIGGELITYLCNILFGTRLTDVMTCYKLIRTDIFRQIPLQCNRFDMDTEIVGWIVHRSIPIQEKGISYHPRSADEGKKINWKDFFRCVWCLLRIRSSQSTTVYTRT